MIDRVRVGPLTYTVRRGRIEGDEHWGLTTHGKNLIQIDTSTSPTEEHSGQILLHETLHAIMHASGAKAALDISSDAEENLIRLLTPWLAMVLRDNPGLTALFAG